MFEFEAYPAYRDYRWGKDTCLLVVCLPAYPGHVVQQALVVGDCTFDLARALVSGASWVSAEFSDTHDVFSRVVLLCTSMLHRGLRLWFRVRLDRVAWTRWVLVARLNTGV